VLVGEFAEIGIGCKWLFSGYFWAMVLQNCLAVRYGEISLF